MVSLWGNKKGDEESDGASRPSRPASSRGGSRPPPPSQQEYERREAEADERTRLLPRQPRPPHSDGYLDPDDPAVRYTIICESAFTYLTILNRSRLTTSGLFASPDSSPSLPLPSPSYGGYYSWSASSSLLQGSTHAVRASSTFPTLP